MLKGNRKILISKENEWLSIKIADKNYFDCAIKKCNCFFYCTFPYCLISKIDIISTTVLCVLVTVYRNMSTLNICTYNFNTMTLSLTISDKHFKSMPYI